MPHLPYRPVAVGLRWCSFACVALVSAASALAGCHSPDQAPASAPLVAHTTLPDQGPPAPDASALPNAVQQEMRVLHEAARDWITAIANTQPGAIPLSISRIHAARQNTDRAVESGAYKPPRGDVEAFKRQDAAFHDSLFAL